VVVEVEVGEQEDEGEVGIPRVMPETRAQLIQDKQVGKTGEGEGRKDIIELVHPMGLGCRLMCHLEEQATLLPELNEAVDPVVVRRKTEFAEFLCLW